IALTILAHASARLLEAAPTCLTSLLPPRLAQRLSPLLYLIAIPKFETCQTRRYSFSKLFVPEILVESWVKWTNESKIPGPAGAATRALKET
ncbi:hypothetical protein B0H63DRAFT_560502, partial [Podospora didyma]